MKEITVQVVSRLVVVLFLHLHLLLLLQHHFSCHSLLWAGGDLGKATHPHVVCSDKAGSQLSKSMWNRHNADLKREQNFHFHFWFVLGGSPLLLKIFTVTPNGG